MSLESSRVTRLLELARGGDTGARDDLMQTVYGELRNIARRHLEGERRPDVLQPTVLVNEVCLRLIEGEALPGENRAQFLAYISRAMRHLLIDHARGRDRLKRGGEFKRVELADDLVAGQDRDIQLIALDEALERLAALDERKSRVVELRYFGGLGVEQSAEALGVSPATVKRDWEVARTWLFNELRRGDTRSG